MIGRKRAGKNRKQAPAKSQGEARRRGTQDESGLNMTNIAAQQGVIDGGSSHSPADGCGDSTGSVGDSGAGSSCDSGGSGGDSGGGGGGD